MLPHHYYQRVWLTKYTFRYWNRVHEQPHAGYEEIDCDNALSGPYMENYLQPDQDTFTSYASG